MESPQGATYCNMCWQPADAVRVVGANCHGNLLLEAAAHWNGARLEYYASGSPGSDPALAALLSDSDVLSTSRTMPVTTACPRCRRLAPTLAGASVPSQT